MGQQEALEPEPVAADSKWIAGISPDQPERNVACRVLGARLKAVCRIIPLAAIKSDEDVEHVHRLRISARRAVEALRVFSGLIDAARLAGLRQSLRRIRLAGDQARDWDVMCQRFSHGDGDTVVAKILGHVRARRREAQGPLVEAYRELEADGLADKIETLLQEVQSHRHGDEKRRFGRQASRYLAPVVKKFFKAAEADLTAAESLHSLRIRAKKLRYTMEILAVAFDSTFRKNLYPQVTLFQDLLGTINDHATAERQFVDWLSKAEDAEQRAFLEGLLLAEERAIADLRGAFLAFWTPKVVSGLKRQFRAFC